MKGSMQANTSSIPTDLQSNLIRSLNGDSDLAAIMSVVVETTATALAASACTVFTIDSCGDRATQLAGSGYQKQFNGKRDICVVPADRVVEQPPPGEQLGLTGWILSTGRPFLAESPESLINHPHHSGRFDLEQSPDGQLLLQSFLGVPIRGFHGDVVGVIKAERRLSNAPDGACDSVNPFSVKDELALETVARVASRCITYWKMAHKGQEANAVTAWARDVIAEAAAAEGEMDSFLDMAVKVTAAAMRADSCGIFLEDESGKTLTERAGIGSQALQKVIRAYPWPDSALIEPCRTVTSCHPPTCGSKGQRSSQAKIGLTAWIAATGKSFEARNSEELRSHCHWRGQYDQWNFPDKDTICGAFLGIPLQVGGRTIGVIKVENTSQRNIPDQRSFGPEVRRRFALLGQDIALAIKRLQIRIPERYSIIQEAQETILEILRGGLELPDLVKKVVTETRALFKAGACALFLKDGDRLVQPRWAASGWAERGPETRSYDLVPSEAIKADPTPDERVGLTVWIAARQEKFTARSQSELEMHPHWRGQFDRYNFEKDEGGHTCQSFMGFPLVIQQGGRKELVGVLKVETKKKKVGDVEDVTYFNELDAIVFDLIAKSAAIAIQNARLQQQATDATQNAWKQFSAMAAHRTGTEAAIIRGAMRWLKDELGAAAENPGVKSYLARVGDALNRIDTFVQEFTQFAKPPEPQLERLNVNELCNQALSYFGEGAFEKVDLRRELARDLPQFWGDREKLLYAFTEMFHNALRAMSNGGNLVVTTRSINEGASIAIEFEDTGPGVPIDQKGKIFEPGFRGRPGGTGLGLAIVQTTVNQHKGVVHEIGMPGKGAHFVIELPIRVPESSQERILIVDDTPPVRHDLEKIVKWDAPARQVLVASNETEAARLLEEHCFDVVVTDINLEESGGTATGGLDVMRSAILKDESTLVVVVTAYGKMGIPVEDGHLPGNTQSVEDVAKSLGCFDFIPRPHPSRDYLDVVRESVTRALEKRYSKKAV